MDRTSTLTWPQVQRLLFGEPEEGRDASDAELDASVVDSLRRLGPLGPYYRRQDVAIRRLWELMAFEPLARRRAARRLPFRDLEVAKAALEHIPTMGSDSELTAIQLARAARWIAEGCRHPQQATAAAELRARASCLEGDAWRQRRDWKRAERHLAAAFGALPQPTGPWTAGMLFRTLAALREDQECLDEATSLSWRAVNAFAKAWAGGEGFDCLARLGAIALKQGNFGHAMTLLTEVRLHRIPNAENLRPEVEVDLARAACLAAAGLSEPANQLLAATLPLRRSIRCESKRIPLEWMECRVALRVGDLETAIRRLEALRLWFRDSYRPSPLQFCLCTIELIAAYGRRGPIEQKLPALLRDLEDLADQESLEGSRGALAQFCEDARSGKVDLESAARKAAREIYRSYLDSPVPRARFGSRRESSPTLAGRF